MAHDEAACGELGHPLRRPETVELRHKRILQRRWDHQGRERRVQDIPVACIIEHARLEHRPRQLLDEKRHAVGAHDDLVQQFGR